MQNRGFPAGESFQFVYSRQNPVFFSNDPIGFEVKL